MSYPETGDGIFSIKQQLVYKCERIVEFLLFSSVLWLSGYDTFNSNTNQMYISNSAALLLFSPKINVDVRPVEEQYSVFRP